MLKKENLYYPDEDFKKKALANDKKIYEKAKKFIPGGVNSPVRAL